MKKETNLAGLCSPALNNAVFVHFQILNPNLPCLSSIHFPSAIISFLDSYCIAIDGRGCLQCYMNARMSIATMAVGVARSACASPATTPTIGSSHPSSKITALPYCAMLSGIFEMACEIARDMSESKYTWLKAIQYNHDEHEYHMNEADKETS